MALKPRIQDLQRRIADALRYKNEGQSDRSQFQIRKAREELEALKRDAPQAASMSMELEHKLGEI